MTTEDALLAAVCDRLDDSLPRLVYSEWLCDQGRFDEAAAWRATADRVPFLFASVEAWSWRMSDVEMPHRVPRPLFDRLLGKIAGFVYRDYPTPRAALLDLTAAWVAVEREKERVCEKCLGLGRGYEMPAGMEPVGACPACNGSGKAVAANG